MKAFKIKKDIIILNRTLTELDLFVKDFLSILKKHSDYLIVSGFVSISSGRTRGTEDIDILIPVMEKNNFINLFKDLNKNGFWCYQGDNSEEIYEYVKNMNSIRFARKKEIIPNMEMIFFDESKKAKFFEFNNFIKFKVQDFEFKVPLIEFEILYKEIILGSEKDLADALHLRTLFSDILDKNKFKICEKIIRQEK